MSDEERRARNHDLERQGVYVLSPVERATIYLATRVREHARGEDVVTYASKRENLAEEILRYRAGLDLFDMGADRLVEALGVLSGLGEKHIREDFLGGS